MFAIGSRLVFSLGSWSTRIRTGFHVPRPTQVPHHEVHSISPTRLSRSLAGLPMPFRYAVVFSNFTGHPHAALQPRSKRFGLLPVRSPLLRESQLMSVPGLLRWFTSPSLAPQDYFIHPSRCMNHFMRVTPFGNLRVTGYVLLTAAYRSLSRPSSPDGS